MSDQEDVSERDHLEQVNAELTESLEKCRSLLKECRTKLAANSNEQAEADQSLQTWQKSASRSGKEG